MTLTEHFTMGGHYMLSWATTLTLLLTITSLWFVRWVSEVCRGRLPPGPIPIPVLGNLHQLAMLGLGNVPKTLGKWGKHYGDMCTFYIGHQRVIVLNSYEAIKEAFSMNAFNGRPNNFFSQQNKHSGISFAEGEFWKIQRRFALSKLKDLGLGKTSFEDKILEEIQMMMKYLENTNGQPIDVQILLTNSVANNITSIIWGERYEYSDERFQSFLMAVNSTVRDLSSKPILDAVFPFLKYLPFDIIGLKKITNTLDYIDSFMSEIIEKHKSAFDPNSINDYVDVYLDQMAQEKNKQDTTFTDLQLRMVLRNLFFAGQETTSLTIRWALLYLTLYPDIQAKVRAEIDDVIGSRTPSIHDRPNLPYTEAAIVEIHRLGMVVINAVPHSANEDTTIRNYMIPKGTTLMANFSCVFLDEKLFPNPRKFDPTRYIENGKLIKAKCEKIIPFSIGRRVCIGESLARMEITLYLTCLLQRFEFSLPDGAPVPPTEGIASVTHSPHPFKLCVKLRKQTDS